MSLDSLAELRTLVLVVDAGSLSAAARSLRVSANAVSQRIQRLESRLGVRLLHRSTRRLSVTEEGRALYLRSVRALAEIDAAEEEIRGAAGPLEGAVRFAISPGGATRGLLQRVRELTGEHPGLRIQMRVATGPVDVLGEALDIAVQYGEPPESGLIVRRLGTVSWVLAAAPDYLARAGRPERVEDLEAHSCLRHLSERVQEEWSLMDGEGREVTVRVRGAFECDDSRVLADAAYSGLGIGFRPEPELERAISRGTLERVLPEYRMRPVPLYALLPPGRLRVERVARFLEILKRAAVEVF